MLVLARKSGEAIVIEGRIRVQVERISRQRVRLLIDAPAEVIVDREEVWCRKHQESTSFRLQQPIQASGK